MHYVTWLGLWVKIKCLNREEFVVVGSTDPEAARPWHTGPVVFETGVLSRKDK